MDEAEVLAFLDEERVMTCATLGPNGFPHLMPLWYVVRDGRLWAWTFAKSQKTKNLERDPRASVQVEAGRDQYHLLRGVMLETEVTIQRARHKYKKETIDAALVVVQEPVVGVEEEEEE